MATSSGVGVGGREPGAGYQVSGVGSQESADGSTQDSAHTAQDPGLRTQDPELSTQHAARSTSHPARSTRHPHPRVFVLLALVLAAGWWYYTEMAVPPANGIVASGTIESEEVSIAPEVAGRIVQILAEEGHRVSAGDVLVKLDDALPRLQLRMATLPERQILELQIDKLNLRSPLDGIVARRSLRVGEVASPGTTVLAVARQDPVELTVYVPEASIGRVKVGQKVEVRVDSFPGEVFPGQVTFISSKAEFTPRNVQTQKDRLNLVFGVKVRIPNADLRLKPGMPADATLRTED